MSTGTAGQNIVAATILQSKLEALVAEMEATLVNTAYSASISDWRRCSAAVFTEQGRLLAVSHPLYMCPLAATVATVIDKYQFDLTSEDVILCNDPYAGGIQVQTFTLVAPVSDGDSIIMYVAVCGHTEDFAGDMRGNYNPAATEIWAEGARCSPVRLVREGKIRKDLLNTLKLNSRNPLAFELDVQAMLASANTGKRRLGELIARYGTQELVSLAATVLDYSERRVRALIERIPPGRYEGAAQLGHDAHGRRDLFIRVALVSTSRDLTLDFSETDAQSAGFMNASRSIAQSLALLPFISAFNGEVPCNDGLLRALSFVTREGTLVHPKYPAPTGWGIQHVGHEVALAVTQALEKALPQQTGRVLASSMLLFLIHRLVRHGNTLEQVAVSDFASFTQSSADGSAACDGWGTTGISARVSLPSIELFEAEQGGRIRSFEYQTDTGGVGEHRGCPSTVAVIELPRPRSGSMHLTAVIVHGEEIDRGASDIALDIGKGPVRLVEVVVNRHLTSDATLTLQTAGGLGWGVPTRRPVERVREDVANGIASIESARTDYGVVIDPRTLAVDKVATRRLRDAGSLDDGERSNG